MVEFELYRYESILEFGLYIYKHTVVQKFSHLYTDVFDDIRLKIKFYIHTYKFSFVRVNQLCCVIVLLPCHFIASNFYLSQRCMVLKAF